MFDPPGVGAVLVPGDGPGDAVGYAVFRPVTEGAVEDRWLDVVEWGWAGDNARDTLLAWLTTVGDQWRRVAIRARPGDRIVDRLREARSHRTSGPGWELWFGASTRLRGPMFSLLNVPSALERVRLAGDLGFTLEVRDGVHPGNAGAWRIEVTRGAAAVTAEDGSAAPRLSLDASVLARIVIGDLLPSEAVAIGRAEVDDAAALPALDSVFRTVSPWTFERF